MILVTGGAGFIGSVLVKELNNLGRKDIIIVDRLRDTLKWKNLRGLKYDRFIHAEDLFSGEFDSIFGQLTSIFHMGACSATTELDMDYLYDNNIAYSQQLFDIAANLDLPIAYASSAATYGAGEFGYDDDHDSISKYLPLNRYGYSKQFFDEWVLRQEIAPSKWFGLKFFNVYGPNEYHKGSMSSIVSKAFAQIKEGGIVKLFQSHKEGYADGEQLRDFIYAIDVARAMIALIDNTKSKDSGIYNMGTGEARSFKDLVVATFNALDIRPNIEFVPMPDELQGQYQYYTQANMSKFKTLFPDFSFHSLEDGVKDYVQSYLSKENPNC
ncbi:MAG: ADP-glyceromanno-heptose 6-epimerase [Bacteriovoracaceae bacterium]|nr:ADP-glyceromanno-heptose 6-epimerase [Bacteriovoracaceae bacterium]